MDRCIRWIKRSVYCGESDPAFISHNGSIGVIGPSTTEFIHLEENIIGFSQIFRNRLLCMTLKSVYVLDLSKPGSARKFDVPQQWYLTAVTSLTILEPEFNPTDLLSPFLIVTQDAIYRVTVQEGNSLSLKTVKVQFAPIWQVESSPMNQLLLYTSPAGLVCCGANGAQRIVAEGRGYWVKKDFAVVFMEALSAALPAKLKLIQAVKDEVSGKAGFKDKSAFELNYDVDEVLMINEKWLVFRDVANRICVHAIKNLMNRPPIVNLYYSVHSWNNSVYSQANKGQHTRRKTVHIMVRGELHLELNFIPN